MNDSDLEFPKETYQNYCFDLHSPSKHAKMILGRENEKLTEKLNSFYYDRRVNSSLNYLDYYTGEVKKDFSKYITLRNFGEGYVGECIDDKFVDSVYSYLIGDYEVGIIFGFEPRPNAIMIMQSQGIKGYRDVWKNFRYSDYGMDLLQEEFGEFKIPEYWLLPAKRNNYVFSWSEKELKIKERFYDKAAKRNGFMFDEKKGLWVKKNN